MNFSPSELKPGVMTPGSRRGGGTSSSLDQALPESVAQVQGASGVLTWKPSKSLGCLFARLLPVARSFGEHSGGRLNTSVVSKNTFGWLGVLVMPRHDCSWAVIVDLGWCGGPR